MAGEGMIRNVRGKQDHGRIGLQYPIIHLLRPGVLVLLLHLDPPYSGAVRKMNAVW
jgi:hypothetical protein